MIRRSKPTPEMKKFTKFCMEQMDYTPSRNGQRAGVRMLRQLYEWGSVQAWDLTMGGESHSSRMLDRMRKHGLVRGRREVCITDEGLELGDSLGFGS